MKSFVFFFILFFLNISVSHAQDSNNLHVDTLEPRLRNLEVRIDSLRNAMSLVSEVFEYHVPRSMEFCGVQVPLHEPHVRERVRESMRALIGTRDRRQTMQSAFELAEYYMPFIDGAFREAGLCADYRYLPVIETKLTLTARSRMGATGPWQIMLNTGRACRLIMTRAVDERRNLARAFECAANHLRTSERLFRSPLWALAAYSTGDGNVRRIIEENYGAAFFDAVSWRSNGSLNQENFSYVYNAIAAKLIFEHPERYGFPRDIVAEFNLENSELLVPRGGTSLVVIARRLHVSPSEFLFWNPEFSNRVIPEGRWLITLPQR